MSSSPSELAGRLPRKVRPEKVGKKESSGYITNKTRDHHETCRKRPSSGPDVRTPDMAYMAVASLNNKIQMRACEGSLLHTCEPKMIHAWNPTQRLSDFIIDQWKVQPPACHPLVCSVSCCIVLQARSPDKSRTYQCTFICLSYGAVPAGYIRDSTIDVWGMMWVSVSQSTQNGAAQTCLVCDARNTTVASGRHI